MQALGGSFDRPPLLRLRLRSSGGCYENNGMAQRVVGHTNTGLIIWSAGEIGVSARIQTGFTIWVQ